MLSFITVWLFITASTLAGISQYKLELTWDIGAPDGYEREMIFINGQYPGPLLKIQQGDWVEVEVLNLLPFNSSIHFHGMIHMRCVNLSSSLHRIRHSSNEHAVG